MNKIVNVLLSIALITVGVSCTEKDPSPTDTTNPPPTSTGDVTSVGTTEGIAITANIGAAGGSIESADKRIRVEIPAGALTSSQTITLQPITNQAPNGKGQAFRLMPHGLQFTKPATISFQYTEEELNGTFAEALGIAYQNEKGIWKVPTGLALDKEAQKISIKTTHFSDWSFFEALTLDPRFKVLDLGGKTSLAVRYVLRDEEDIFVSALYETGIELELRNPKYLVDAKFIDKWELKGDGELTTTTNTATYQAPGYIPGQNPVRVEVSIKSKGIAVGLLIARIYVAPEGVSFQIDGGDWQTYPGAANINTAQNVIQAKSGANSLQLGWIGTPQGQFHWTLNTNVYFGLHIGQKIYENRYAPGPAVSGGALTIDDAGQSQLYVLGTFNIEPAGWIQPDPYNPLGTARIRGIIRVKRI